MFDGEAFGQAMAEIVKGHVERATSPLLARIDALERRELAMPEKGDPGEPGKDGTDGVGEPGKDGADGVGLADALIDSDGALVLTMTDGRTKTLGRVVGHDGKDGKDGVSPEPVPPITLDDFDVTQVDDRCLEFSFRKGDVTHSFEIVFPVILDRGVWVDGKTYAKGDAVSWAGSLWIAQRDEPAKPDTADSGWRLAVKKGRDGKSAK